MIMHEVGTLNENIHSKYTE